MNKLARILTISLTVLALTSCAGTPPKDDMVPASAPQKVTGYAQVNGLKMYYEMHGEGFPLVFLHGSYYNIPLSQAVIDELSKKNLVIAVELQGHGRTADIGRPLSYKALADDVTQLLKSIDIKSANVIGYSFGGTVAFQMAIQSPEVINKVVILSSVTEYKGWTKTVRDALVTITPKLFEKTPLKTEYDRLAPDPKNWEAFVTKMSKFDTQDFDLGRENIRKIKAPVLLVKGDNDGVELDHMRDVFRLLGGDVFGDMQPMPKSQLAILPGTSHLSLVADPVKLGQLVQPFLDAKQQSSQ